jgi:hypothetical protein
MSGFFSLIEPTGIRKKSLQNTSFLSNKYGVSLIPFREIASYNGFNDSKEKKVFREYTGLREPKE